MRDTGVQPEDFSSRVPPPISNTMSAPTILLFHGKGIISAAIRWQTRSRYSHAAILLPDERTIVEAWPGAGVRAKEITDWRGVTRFSFWGAESSQFSPERMSDFLANQIGKKYDYRGVARFLSRHSDGDQENKRWFCSELVCAAFAAAGVQLFNARHWEISPGTLSICPLLHQI
jgi:uncharacterized protein YycO